MIISSSTSSFINDDKQKDKSNSTFDDSFSNEMMQFSSNEEKDEPIVAKRDINQMYEDIKSLLRTGFTEEELKHLEEIIEEIMEKMKEENPDIDDIKKLMTYVESELMKIKKELTGYAVKTSDDNKSEQGTLESKLQSINETFTSLVSGVEKKKASLENVQKDDFFRKNHNQNTSSLEELQLLHQLKDFS